MILDWTAADKPLYGRLYDANGVEILLPVVFCNTETGTVVHMKKVGCCNYELDESGYSFKHYNSRFPAPLKFEPHNESST